MTTHCISIVVLQEVQREIKIEAEEREDVGIKHEQDVALEFISCVKVLKEVKETKTANFYCFICL